MIHTLFPSFVYESPLTPKSVKKMNQEIVTEAFQFKKMDHEGRLWSEQNYPRGYTSYGSIDNIHKISSTFEGLEKMIRRHVFKYARFLEMDINPKQLQMSSCWINIMPPSVTHTMHIHPLSVISGTYYVQTPKNCSAIKFEDPRMDQFMATPPRKSSAQLKNQRFFKVQPKAGSVVLFESWMRHEVPPNQAAEDRISISFNYDWV